MLLFSIQANRCRNARSLEASQSSSCLCTPSLFASEAAGWRHENSPTSTGDVNWKRENLVGLEGLRSQGPGIPAWIHHSPRQSPPYLALDFHPRSLVSDLLQSEGIHQEWEVNPSFLLYKGTKHHTHCCVRCVPNSDLHTPALHGASVHSTYLVGPPDLCPGGLFHGQLPQKHQSSPLDQSHQDQESHPFLGGEPGLRVSGELLF